MNQENYGKTSVMLESVEQFRERPEVIAAAKENSIVLETAPAPVLDLESQREQAQTIIRRSGPGMK